MEKKEYIEREKLLTVLEELFHATDPCGEEQFGYLKAHRIVREAPAADVAPVVHGEWIKTEKGYKCSQCNCLSGLFDQNLHSIFCPWCGAKMDGGKIDDR